MAGDWVKMRVWLRRDPRVGSMSDFLAIERRFMNWLTDPVQQSCRESAYEHNHSDITRFITVGSLLEIWGVARDRGKRENDDLILKHCGLENLDDICGVPMMGEAMEYVGWAETFSQFDEKNREIQCVRFPNFFKQEEPPEDRYKRQHAEAQARYRAKKSDLKVTVTSDVTVTSREEKRREEIKPPVAPLPDWVPVEAWDGFVEMRTKIRAPLTERAKKLALAELDKLRATGCDVRVVLDQSTANSWKGLFAPKGPAPKPTDWRKDPRFEGAT